MIVAAEASYGHGLGAPKSHSGTPVGPRRERNLWASFREISKKSFRPVRKAAYSIYVDAESSCTHHIERIRIHPKLDL